MLIRIYDAYHSAKFIQISKKQIVQKLNILVKRIFQKKNQIQQGSTNQYNDRLNSKDHPVSMLWTVQFKLATPSSFALWTIKILIEGTDDFYEPYEMVNFPHFLNKNDRKCFPGQEKFEFFGLNRLVHGFRLSKGLI